MSDDSVTFTLRSVIINDDNFVKDYKGWKLHIRSVDAIAESTFLHAIIACRDTEWKVGLSYVSLQDAIASLEALIDSGSPDTTVVSSPFSPDADAVIRQSSPGI